MKQIRATYEQAIAEYNTRFGKSPTVNEINDLYHRYSHDWKHYGGFTDWLANNVG